MQCPNVLKLMYIAIKPREISLPPLLPRKIAAPDLAKPKQQATVGQVLSRPGAGSTLAPLFNHFNGLKEHGGADHDNDGAGDSYLPTMGVLRNLIQLGASVGKGAR